MTQQERITRPFQLLSAAVFTLALILFVLSWRSAPVQPSLELILLVVAAALSENFAFSLPAYSVSLSYTLTVAAIVFAGPAAAGLVAIVSSTNLDEIRSRRPPAFLAFNMGQLVLITMAASWAYVTLGGKVMQTGPRTFEPWSSQLFPQLLIPLVAAAAICAVGQVVMPALGLSTLGKGSFAVLVAGFVWLVPSQFALAFVGYLIAQVLALSPLALPLFIAPLLVARQLYQRYAELRGAYVDTVRSLVGALEAKDPYTRGHSERVSGYATQIGEEMGMDARTLERLEYAALLHDLGKLAVPGAVLTKPGKLDSSELERIREHPARGAEMIGRIPPLKDLVQTVAQHHERIDGRGYPYGLPNEEISLPARVLAVADSYDAMTTTRAYRSAMTHEEALAELLRGANLQFDEEAVDCFVRAGVRCSDRLRDSELAPVSDLRARPSIEGEV